MLGAAFKPLTDDVRDSPALNVAAALHLRGAQVVVYDPEASQTAQRMFPTLTYADSIEEAASGSDALLVLTEWSEFATTDPVAIGRVAARQVIIDARNCLDAEKWRAAGWNLTGLGIASTPVDVRSRIGSRAAELLVGARS